MSSPNEESMDEQINRLAARIEEIDQSSAKLFEEIGISPHQLHHFMMNPENFTKEAYQELATQDQALEEILERRIDTAQATIKRKPTPFDMKAGSHWILMK